MYFALDWVIPFWNKFIAASFLLRLQYTTYGWPYYYRTQSPFYLIILINKDDEIFTSVFTHMLLPGPAKNG